MKIYWIEGTSLVTPTEDIWQFCSLGSLYFDVTAQLVQKVKADAESHLLGSYPPSTLFSFLLYTPYNIEVKSSLQSDPGFSSPPTFDSTPCPPDLQTNLLPQAQHAKVPWLSDLLFLLDFPSTDAALTYKIQSRAGDVPQ